MAHVYNGENLPELCQTALISQMNAKERIDAYFHSPAWQDLVQEVNQNVHSLNIIYGAAGDLQATFQARPFVTCAIARKVTTTDIAANENNVNGSGSGNGNGNGNGNKLKGPTVLGVTTERIRSDTLTKWNSLQYPALYPTLGLGREGLDLKALLRILAAYPNLRQMVFIAAESDGHLNPRIVRALFEPFAVLDGSVIPLPVKVDYLANSMPLHLVLSLAGTPADQPLLHSVIHFKSRDAVPLPLLCATCPNLRSLSLGENVKPRADRFLALASLTHLSELSLNFVLSAKHEKWNQLKANISQLPPTCLQSLKSIKLMLFCKEHALLPQMLQKLELPSVEEIALEHLSCDDCHCGTWGLRAVPRNKNDETRVHLLTVLRLLHQCYPAVPLNRLTFRLFKSKYYFFYRTAVYLLGKRSKK